MDGQLRISAKNLGELALPNFCPRCFWIKQRAAGKLPFQIFPGIFSSIDSYTKKLIHGYVDGHAGFPGWLGELGGLTGYLEPPHFTRFRTLDEPSGVILHGTPDGVFTRRDGSYLIVDYKTAKFTGGQDRLLPMYEVQLNAYAAIGERSGLVAPVSGLALIYMEPVTHEQAASDAGNQRPDGFAMGFAAHIHPVALEPDVIPTLLKRVAELVSLENPPAGRPGCEDCARLSGLLELLGPAD